MALYDIFRISGSAMAAENIRLSVTSSNLANANSVGASADQAYHARMPVFASVLETADGEQKMAGVQVREIVESKVPLTREYQPGHPLADADGFITNTNVNTVEEMTNMIAATRAYQNNVEVMKSARDLLLKTLELER